MGEGEYCGSCVGGGLSRRFVYSREGGGSGRRCVRCGRCVGSGGLGGGGYGVGSTSGARTIGGQGRGGEGGELSATETSETLSKSGEVDSLPSQAAEDPSETSPGVHTPEQREGPLGTNGKDPELNEHHGLSGRNPQQQETIHQQVMQTLHRIFLFMAIHGVPISIMTIWHHQIAPSSVDWRSKAISICEELIIDTMFVFLYVGIFEVLSEDMCLKLKSVLKYFSWLLVGSILPKAMALYLADLVRRMIPQLAPCNALHDDVTCNATTSAFISHTTCVDLILLAKRERIVDINNRYKRRTHFSNQNFRIGGGLVSVMKLSENQYRFTSSARGTFLEDFVAPTNWERMSIILSILELWEASPKVGVVENLILWRGGIFCHALNVKEIVEGVLKSPYQFSIFHLVEKRRFFVGCGDRGVDEHIPWVIFMASIGAALSGYYQLKNTYPNVAIGIFVTSIVLAFIILIVSSSSRLFTQSCFYWLCTLLCWMNANWRLGVYILLKKVGCTSLPYCDEFQPDKLLREDRNVEVNSLLMTPYKYREGSIAMECSPDWTMFPTINIKNLDTHDDKGAPWINIAPNVNNTNNNMRFKLFKALRKHDVNYDAIIFKMEFTYSNFLLKSSRMIEVTSVYDETKPQDKMIGHISSDGRTRPYKWSVSSFHLFVYLVLMWGRLNHGVIEKDENFMFRTYYHVFNIQGLAKHIVDNNLEKYFVSLADQTPQSASAISKLVRIAKEVVNVIISCCNRLQVPCKTALGQESLSSV